LATFTAILGHIYTVHVMKWLLWISGC